MSIPPPTSGLPPITAVLAVCAHPDDESFGLGAVLAALAERGTRIRVLCLTHGEASTLGPAAGQPLAQVRAAELQAAANVLGIDHVQLLAYPDGHLEDVPVAELADVVDGAVADAAALIVFDEGGVSGHLDHRRATAAAVTAADRHRLPVLAWALREAVATQLNSELGTSFVGRPDRELDIGIEVDRTRQQAAIACHLSQSRENPVLRRRLDLLGAHEHLRWLRRGRPDRR